jgi:hypothetical protein
MFVWEDDLFLDLQEAFQSFTATTVSDLWFWSKEDGGMYSVRSAYSLLEVMSENEGENISELEEEVFQFLWRCPAPSKVIAF